MVFTYLALVLCIIILFSLRSVYRIIYPNALDVDAVFHLHVIKNIRENGHRAPEKIDQVATGGYFAYPYFMHWILSFIPEKHVNYVERYFSPISETLLLGVVLLLVPFEVITLEQALLVCLLLILTPHFMRPDMAHSIGISARKPGVILTTASIFFFLQWVHSGYLPMLAVALTTGTLIFLTSKFSVQAFLFISAALSLTVSYEAMLLFLASLILAIITTKGRYIEVLRVHLIHLADYARNKQFKKLDQSVPNPLAFVKSVLNASSFKDLLEPLHRSKLRPFIDFPYATAVLLAYLLVIFGGYSVPLPPGYDTWIITGLLSMGIISIPGLLFLGEPERYLEYIFLPSAVLIVHSFETIGPVYQAVVLSIHLGAVIVIGVYIWGFGNIFFSRRRFEEFRKIIEEFSEEPAGTVVVHPSYLAKHVAWFTDHEIVDTIGNQTSNKEAVEELNRLFPEKYAYVTKDINWLKEMYDPEWVVFDLEKMEEHPDIGLGKPESQPTHSNELYEVYRFEDLQKTS